MVMHVQMKFEMPRQRGKVVTVGQVPEAALQNVTPEKTWMCDICGNVMLNLHCKLRCTNCGFMRDCSDP